MRTKALFGLAVLAAGALTASAQIYSQNIVGYVNVTVPANDFAMLANPLNASGNNNVITNVLSGVFPESTTLYTFTGGSYDEAETYYPGFGWYPGTRALDIGKGFFIKAPGGASITFVGEVQTGNTTISVPAGLSMLGLPAPQQLGLGDTTIGPVSSFNWPASESDTVYRWDTSVSPARFSQAITYYPSYGWYDSNVEGGGPVAGPAMNIAEGFFMSTSTAKSWTRTFTP